MRRALRVPGRVPIAIASVLLAGLAVRVFAMVAYDPAVQNLSDSVSYLSQATGELFSDPTHPAGYGAFLRVLHLPFQDVSWTIAIQHGLGLLTALVAYLTARRVGAPAGLAAVAAATVALNGDQIFLEHAIMADTLFTFLVAVGFAAAVMALGPSGGAGDAHRRWLLVAGLAIGAASTARFVGVPLLVLVAGWAVLALGAGWRARAASAATVLAGGLAVLLVYVVLNGTLAGNYGLTGPGWGWYVRSAQFADCTQFTPPAGTRRLCEDIPTEDRPGPDFYSYEPGSPAVQAFGPTPNGAARVSAFGRETILNQPWDYLKTVANDFLRYFAPTYEATRDFAGVGFEVMEFTRRAPATEVAVGEAIDAYYEDEQLAVRGGVEALGNYQQLFRIYGILLGIAMVIVVLTLRAASARERATSLLGLGFGLTLLAVPVATVIYSQRYTLPAVMPLAVAAVVGTTAASRALGERLLNRRQSI